MKQDNTLKYLGVAAIFYFGLKWLGNRVYTNLLIGTPAIESKTVTAQGINLTISIPITNQSNVSLPIQSFIGGLVYGQYALADLNMIGPVNIESGETTLININAFINYQNLANQIISIVTSGDWLNAARVVGVIKASGLSIPVNQAIKIA
ncbi:MAG: hypothetical protein KDC34_19095 [Saprospiraceae bacterium]|nr:hypothetical protein [Saprospiraceae bacterium]